MKLLLTLVSIQFSSIIMGQTFPGLDSLQTIPFIEDTVQHSRNLFSHFKKIGTIENSQSDFELCIYPDMERGGFFPMLFIVRSEKKKLVTNLYYSAKNSINLHISGSTIIERDSDSVLFNWPEDKIKQADDSFLVKAVDLGLFNIADQKRFIDSLKSKSITLYDLQNNKAGFTATHGPYGYDYFEIKLGNKIRGFRISHNADIYYRFNQEISKLKDYHDLYLYYASYLRPTYH